jgi:hypothetical protein
MEPLFSFKQDNLNFVVYLTDSNKHRLTVAHDGNVRIKISRKSSPEESNKIYEGFVKVAKEANLLNCGTLRGHIKSGKDAYSTITLYTDSKKQNYTFKYK